MTRWHGGRCHGQTDSVPCSQARHAPRRASEGSPGAPATPTDLQLRAGHEPSVPSLPAFSPVLQLPGRVRDPVSDKHEQQPLALRTKSASASVLRGVLPTGDLPVVTTSQEALSSLSRRVPAGASSSGFRGALVKPGLRPEPVSSGDFSSLCTRPWSPSGGFC